MFGQVPTSSLEVGRARPRSGPGPDSVRGRGRRRAAGKAAVPRGRRCHPHSVERSHAEAARRARGRVASLVRAAPARGRGHRAGVRGYQRLHRDGHRAVHGDRHDARRAPRAPGRPAHPDRGQGRRQRQRPRTAYLPCCAHFPHGRAHRGDSSWRSSANTSGSVTSASRPCWRASTQARAAPGWPSLR